MTEMGRNTKMPSTCHFVALVKLIHMTMSAQRGIETLDVIGHGEKKPVGDDEKLD